MPEAETTELSVLFFVSVAAEALIRDNDICSSPFLFSILFDLTGHTGGHIAHHIVKPFFLETRGGEVRAASADHPIGFGVGTPKLAGRADIEASPASPAVLRLNIKGSPDTPLLPSAPKTNGLGHHLFFAHSNAQTAKDAVFVFLLEPLLPNPVSRGQVLNCF
jgi:hypothetical protein